MQTKPTKAEIEQAHKRIHPFVHKTPILTSTSIDKIAGCSLFFKCENFQKVGAFKMRGAANAVFSVSPQDRVNGFATHSSGNHGQAVAKAARLADVPAYVVMPHNSIKVKIEAVKGYGAEVVLCEPNDRSREDTCNDLIEKTNARFVHPFEDSRIIAGQATVSKELIEEVPNLDVLTCPIGGGGLASGTCLSAKHFSPSTIIIGTEPEAVNDAYLSFQKGQIDAGNLKYTVADGLRTTIGNLTFEIIKQYMDSILTVSEDELIDAMKLVWERMKILIEPSSAVPLAAILKHKERFENKR
ncbi:MAG: pyridoxal-phosphate dependent enzyme, partial [Cytophagales bacterium]|nr:pyridoxal-phosphate dependent enzyme [Cytophagales bacterium]